MSSHLEVPSQPEIHAAPGPDTPLLCPICGMENAHDAVFCSNHACHKALGDFRYVREELQQEAEWHETLADRVTGFIGKPHFIVVHIAWILVWVAANSGILMLVRHFDDYPYSLLGLLLAVEAIFISGFVLISQNRQNGFDKKQAELDYEVNVQTYRKINEIDGLLKQIAERLAQIEARDREVAARENEPRSE